MKKLLCGTFLLALVGVEFTFYSCENRIIKDNTLSQIDKTVLTSGILIGIESYEYWDLNNAYWLSVGEQHFNPKS